MNPLGAVLAQLHREVDKEAYLRRQRSRPQKSGYYTNPSDGPSWLAAIANNLMFNLTSLESPQDWDTVRMFSQCILAGPEDMRVFTGQKNRLVPPALGYPESPVDSILGPSDKHVPGRPLVPMPDSLRDVLLGVEGKLESMRWSNTEAESQKMRVYHLLMDRADRLLIEYMAHNDSKILPVAASSDG